MPLLLCLTSLGCATADLMRTDDARRPPTRPADVKVFVDEPARPYSTIGIVQASDQGWGVSLETLKRKMVQKAAAAGGEAVILGRQSTQPGGMYFMPIGAISNGSDLTERYIVGKVIVFAKD